MGSVLRFFGPLTTEEAAPLQRLSLTHTVEGADLIEAGSLQADFWMGYANIFEQDSAATHDLFLDMAVERNLASWASGVVQLSVASPRLQGFGDPELDGWPVNLVFGVTGQVADGWKVDISFQEDIPANTPAVDFTLGIGVRRSW